MNEENALATERALFRAGQLIVTLMGEVEYWKAKATETTQEAPSGNTEKASQKKAK